MSGRLAVCTMTTFVALVSACTSPIEGTAAPSATTPEAAPLVGMSACLTLDKALTGQGFPAASLSTADPEHACSTLKHNVGTYGLTLQDGQTIEENIDHPDRTETGHVRERRAILERNLNGTELGCAVRMEVPPRSRAIAVVALATGTTEQACDAVRRLAESVELLLPKTG
ncbi:hypothetical protein [Amycolatopsis jejuensis]|uniref:hypothetical protein n=1 Tax=Amycolatopsis jejuensis TaxID=330084 RepID=UPI00052442D1|nr:hypothetical protein [Amycolatopsis jejuensis]